jgi:hypothetical protein
MAELMSLRWEETMNKELLADAKAMGLTARQIAQAQREGVTSLLGLRRIEKNSRSKMNEITLARLMSHRQR